MIDPRVLAKIDGGGPGPRRYDEAYFETERTSARDRAYGSSLARCAEALLYARIPVRRFLDVGTGHGYLLDALAMHLPSHRDAFAGVELFPPPGRSTHPNYIEGSVASAPGTYDAGSCIEVIEHLTPAQLARLLGELATRSNPGALYIVNSGQPRYVLDDDPGYLDPDGRGHIFSYSLEAVALLAEPQGFRVLPLRGKTWAFLLEYDRADPSAPEDRIWSALPENVALLSDPDRGTVLRILGLESARAYL
jgi:methyltransferase family protein